MVYIHSQITCHAKVNFFIFIFLTQLLCQLLPTDTFWGNERMQIWYKGITTTSCQDTLPEPGMTVPQFTLAVNRRVHYNFYHTIQELYSTFLMMEFFNMSQSQTNVLFVEKYQETPMDLIWKNLFNSTCNITSLPKKTLYNNLILSLSNHDNPMNEFDAPSLPLVEEFRDYILSTYRINGNTYSLRCKNLNIVFVWRNHNITYSETCLKKSLSRKTRNVPELVRSLRNRFPNFTVRAMQMEILNFQQQLRLMSKTDILVGMIGAGLIHSLFLPPHAGLIELRPYFWRNKDRYFEAVARWRKLKYIMWQNNISVTERSRYRNYFQPAILNNLVGNIAKSICNEQH